MLLLLGQIPLETTQVIGLSGDREWTIVSHETIEDLPVLQHLGRQAAPIQVTARLHRSLGTPQVMLDALAAMGDSGKVMGLSLGSGRLLGHFVLQKLGVRRTWTTDDGELLSCDITLTLEEHRTPEMVVGGQLAVEGFTGPDRTAPRTPDIDRDPGDVPLSEITRSA